MNTRLGIRFIKVDGTMKIIPEIDLEGTVDKKLFIDKIVKGVGELSKGDAALLKLMGIE